MGLEQIGGSGAPSETQSESISGGYTGTIESTTTYCSPAESATGTLDSSARPFADGFRFRKTGGSGDLTKLEIRESGGSFTEVWSGTNSGSWTEITHEPKRVVEVRFTVFVSDFESYGQDVGPEIEWQEMALPTHTHEI